MGLVGSLDYVHKAGSVPAATYLVLGVEDNSLGVGHTDHMVVKGGGGQPDAGGELVVEQGELRDEPLRLLLLGGERGQPFADRHQGLDELPLGGQSDGLRGTDSREEAVKKPQEERPPRPHRHSWCAGCHGDQGHKTPKVRLSPSAHPSWTRRGSTFVLGGCFFWETARSLSYSPSLGDQSS